MNDYSFSEETGNVLPSDEAGSIKIDPKTGTVTLNINTYQLATKELIVETVLHETLDHGHKTKDKLNGKKVSSEAQDHKALRDKDKKHKGYKQYDDMKMILLQMHNINYQQMFQQQDSYYKSIYDDIK